MSDKFDDEKIVNFLAYKSSKIEENPDYTLVCLVSSLGYGQKIVHFLPVLSNMTEAYQKSYPSAEITSVKGSRSVILRFIEDAVANNTDYKEYQEVIGINPFKKNGDKDPYVDDYGGEKYFFTKNEIEKMSSKLKQ